VAHRVGVLGRYFWLMIFPLHLSADYSFEQIPLVRSAAEPLFLLSALACAALAAAGLFSRRADDAPACRSSSPSARSSRCRTFLSRSAP